MEKPSADTQQDVKVELRMPYGEGGGGFLTLQAGDTRVTAEYTPAKVELFRVLSRAFPQFEEFGVRVGIYGSVHVVSHLAGRPSLPVGVHADGYLSVHRLPWPTALSLHASEASGGSATRRRA